jgi:hypothetical protein
MCEAVLCFCFCTIDALAKLGIEQTAEEQEATLCAWKTVGHLLGLCDDLQPTDVAEGRALHKQLFERSCVETMESKVLIEEVCHIMGCMAPTGMKSLPPSLMRYLMGERVANQLRVLTWTSGVWAGQQVFARLAKMMCPWVVQWMATCKAARSHELLPEALATRFGSSRV